MNSANLVDLVIAIPEELLVMLLTARIENGRGQDAREQEVEQTAIKEVADNEAEDQVHELAVQGVQEEAAMGRREFGVEEWFLQEEKEYALKRSEFNP